MRPILQSNNILRIRHKIQKGFTLIELMIVVAIIGILASIALPAYQTYVAKSTITSILATATGGKTPIFQFYTDNGTMPSPADFAANSDLLAFDKIMKNQLSGGPHPQILMHKASDTYMHYHIKLGGINGNVNDKVIWFKYKDDGNNLHMDCQAQTSIDTKYLPKQCKH